MSYNTIETIPIYSTYLLSQFKGRVIMAGFHFFAMLSRMKYINRWGLMRNTKTENISEHSHEVCYIAHALALIAKNRLNKDISIEKCLALALYHDAGEILTGDMPTPIKYYNPEIKDAYKKVEAVAANKLVSMLPSYLKNDLTPLLCDQDDTSHEASLVKAADKISALIHCIEEEKAGNKEFSKAKTAIYNTVTSLSMPEVDIFISDFLESYYLTLDEQD